MKYPRPDKEAALLEEIGWRLQDKRRQAGINQRDFAKMLAVHHNSVVNWERGNRQIPVVKLRAICIALALTPEEIDYVLCLGAEDEDI